MSRTFGPLCPDGHGLLYDSPGWGGRRWCSNSAHGGNGKFFFPPEIVEGWWDGRKAAKPGAPVGSAVREVVAARVTRAGSAKAEPKQCKCGCGGMTKGGTFLPGHDARYHAAQAKAALPSILR